MAKHHACPMALPELDLLKEMENFNRSRITVAADQRWETTSDTSSPAFNYELAHLHFFLFFSCVSAKIFTEM